LLDTNGATDHLSIQALRLGVPSDQLPAAPAGSPDPDPAIRE